MLGGLNQFIFLVAVSSSLLVFIQQVKCDTPANCTYDDFVGDWLFSESSRNYTKDTIKTFNGSYSNIFILQLRFPHTAIDEAGNIGYWTVIYNQGVEVVINNRKYFAFSYYEQNGQNVTSYCYRTFPGWAHDTGVNAKNWSSYVALKMSGGNKAKEMKLKQSSMLDRYHDLKPYRTNTDFIDKINAKQKEWTARHYEFLEGRTVSDLVRMAGGKKSKIYNKPKPAPVTEEVRRQVAQLPDSFDWRDVDGVNYVSPIRDQGSCGSCYAFASMAMNEARLRIQTNNTQQTVFSTQDIIDCSQYSQGCDGGFPYLVSGKFAEDYGLVEESCAPYTGKPSGSCSRPYSMSSCQTSSSPIYSTNYRYIGGFYGASSEPLMRLSLVKNGPIAVSFEVYDDFLQYSGGIYHHTGLTDSTNFRFNPFELTNHVVVIVGYGTDASSGQDYWIVKNSWSPKWGENGFFRIRRGNDECAIESISVESNTVVA